ncbi:MAG: hypothetical protein KBC64_06235 [Simkaniaceae bacterium]|nr:hypothetical protein [Simkaniaceae bacterium]
MRIKSYIFLLLVLSHNLAFSEKVLVITSAYNRPDFIELQDQTLKKFLKDDYEFVVFNDSPQPHMRQAIMDTCQRLGIQCINIPQSIHTKPYLKRLPGDNFQTPSVRNSNVVQYALDTMGFAHEGIVAILDSDMFLVKEFSIKQFLEGYEIGGVPQAYENRGIRIPYIWIGIAFLDMSKLPDRQSINFNCGKIQGVPVDAGGYTYYYLSQHPEIQVRYFPSFHSSNFSCPECLKRRENYPCPHNRNLLREIGLSERQIDFVHSGLENVEFFIEGTFFHYRSGTNWDKKTQAFHDNKTRIFNAYMEELLK